MDEQTAENTDIVLSKEEKGRANTYLLNLQKILQQQQQEQVAGFTRTDFQLITYALREYICYLEYMLEAMNSSGLRESLEQVKEIKACMMWHMLQRLQGRPQPECYSSEDLKMMAHAIANFTRRLACTSPQSALRDKVLDGLRCLRERLHARIDFMIT